MITARHIALLNDHLASPDAEEADTIPSAAPGTVKSAPPAPGHHTPSAAPAPAAAVSICAAPGAEIDQMRRALAAMAVEIREHLAAILAAQAATGWPDLAAVQTATSALVRECDALNNDLFTARLNLDWKTSR